MPGADSDPGILDSDFDNHEMQKIEREAAT